MKKRRLSDARCYQAADQTDLRFCFHKILCRKQVFLSRGERGRCLVTMRQTPERKVGFDPHSGRRVVSLSKIH